MSFTPKRKAHIMKGFSTTRTKKVQQQLPSNLLFFDTETKDANNPKKMLEEQHELWFGYVNYLRLESNKITREGTQRFTKIDQFWRIIKSRIDKHRPLYCFAHNLGFDLTILDFWLHSEKYGYDFQLLVLDDPPTIIKVKIDDCPVYFIDTLNYFRTSLAKLGKSVGIEKLEMPSAKTSKEDWNRYGLNDVLILREVILKMLRFIAADNLGSFAFTAASLAMNIYKRSFMEHQIFIHDRKNICELERSAYYGGLVHNFFLGSVSGITVHHLDVNSLYPSVMLNEFPTKLLGDKHSPSINFAKSCCKEGCCVASVVVDSERNIYPKRIEGRLCMVKGEFETSLTGVELQRAIDEGDIKKINHIAFYSSDRIFVKWVNYLWQKRRHYQKLKDGAFETFCKLLLNSLYGKFGQRAYNWQNMTPQAIIELYRLEGKELPDDYETSLIFPNVHIGIEKAYLFGLDNEVTFRRLGDKLQIKLQMGEHFESFPLIAAYVTAYGRQRLIDLINIAGERQVFYCDTDSLFVTSKGLKRLQRAGELSQTELGKLKKEGETTKACFYAPKDYLFADLVKRKGISARAIQLSENKFQQLQFEKLKSVLNRGGEPYIKIKTIIKELKRSYNKGEVMPDGWTEPYTISNGQVLRLF